MTIQENIKEEMKNAMKAKDQVRLTVLRGLMSAFTNELVATGKTPQEPIDDGSAMDVIKRAAKQRKDAIDQFTQGGRPELAADEQAELKVIEEFLPEQMSEEQITTIIDETIAETGASTKQDMGKLMGALMPKFGGQADGAIVKRIVDEKLQ